jgi:outer membrane protein, multidrug efflux system
MTRHTIAVATAAAVAALLAACASVGPDYQRPSTALPAQYSTSVASPTTMRADWWVLFGDAALTQLVEQALANNQDIAQAVARVEQAQAQANEVDSASLPSVNAGATAGRAQIGAGVPSNASGRLQRGNDFKLSLATSYEVDFWGRLRRSNEAARATVLASSAARDTVRLSVAGAVAQTWFALQSLDAQSESLRNTLATRDNSLRLISARLKAGTGSRLDVEQAEGLRADAALQLRDTQRQRALALSLLSLLTGDASLNVPTNPLSLDVALPVPPAGLPSSLLERRPDIARAEAQLVAANAQIGAARAAMFPTLSLTGALGNESSALSNLLKGPAVFWSLAAGLTAPIFDAGRNAARVEQAGARQREAVAAYQSAVATAFKETSDALNNLSAARDSLTDVLKREAATNNALRLAKARFDAGYSGYLELLEAQRSATNAGLDVVRNKQAQLAASVELMKAIGGGWGARNATP